MAYFDQNSELIQDLFESDVKTEIDQILSSSQQQQGHLAAAAVEGFDLSGSGELSNLSWLHVAGSEAAGNANPGTSATEFQSFATVDGRSLSAITTDSQHGNGTLVAISTTTATPQQQQVSTMPNTIFTAQLQAVPVTATSQVTVTRVQPPHVVGGHHNNNNVFFRPQIPVVTQSPNASHHHQQQQQQQQQRQPPPTFSYQQKSTIVGAVLKQQPMSTGLVDSHHRHHHHQASALTNSPNTSNCNNVAEEKSYPKPGYSYSCLIAMALKNSKTGSLPVSEIYNFMCENFPYFKTAPDGWKNSVRHNLSLNKCFEKIEKPSGGATRKGCLWGLNPEKITKMDDEIQKWKKKDPGLIRRSTPNPENLESLERGIIGQRATATTLATSSGVGRGGTVSTVTAGHGQGAGQQQQPPQPVIAVQSWVLEPSLIKSQLGLDDSMERPVPDIMFASDEQLMDVNHLDSHLHHDLDLQANLFDDDVKLDESFGFSAVTTSPMTISTSPIFETSSPSQEVTRPSNFYSQFCSPGPKQVSTF